MLSAFLVWYDIPHPTQLVEAGLQSKSLPSPSNM